MFSPSIAVLFKTAIKSDRKSDSTSAKKAGVSGRGRDRDGTHQWIISRQTFSQFENARDIPTSHTRGNRNLNESIKKVGA